MSKRIPRKYQRYTDEAFKNGDAFQAFLRSGKQLKYDYVIVGGILFTMEEYDLDGKQVVWANLKHGMQMVVDTSNRYGALGYTDAAVYVYPSSAYRNDISYAE